MDLRSSESFANNSTVATASFPVAGGNPTTSAAATSGTINYDAAARSYTLSAEGRTLTFLPADIDAAQTTATLTVYKKVAGNTTDTLTLTKPGTEGRFTYTYVGGAFWQRTVQGATAISGSFDAFAYGMKTPNGAVPRTGRAEYGVDLIGAQSTADTVIGVTGQGIMQVDFATGAIVTKGTVNARLSGGAFSSEARLASDANSFAGTFRYSDFGEFSGTLNGAFYGPAAQEVGAAYSARQADGKVAAGVLIGRGAAVTATNATVTAPTVNEFFANDAGRLSVTLSGKSGSNTSTGTFSGGMTGSTALAVNYDAASRSYSLISPDRSQQFGPDGRSGTTTETLRFRAFDFPVPPYRQTVPSSPLLKDLQFVRAGRWLVEQGADSATSYTFHDFTYGVRTPDAAVPRSGRGGFVIGILGTAADPDFRNLINFGGTGTAFVDFASFVLTGSGELDFFEDNAFGLTQNRGAGGFTLNATVASGANRFNGTLGFTGIGTYSGAIAGRFYGPNAEELGGAFSATDSGGGIAVGTLVGRKDASLTASVPTLLNLESDTRLSSLGILNPFSGYSFSRAYFVYDTSTRTYGFYGRGGDSNAAQVAARFGPAQAVASATDATFSGYAGTGPAGQGTFTASLLNPGANNPKIALTYTSYADILITGRSTYPERELAVFGVSTPASQVPRSGTGSYSGIVFGHGERSIGYTGRPSDDTFAIDGTATLDVDFGAQSFTSALTVATRPPGSTVLTPFGTLEYKGRLLSGSLFGDVTDAAASGKLEGEFYGANASEFGLLFSYSKLTGGVRTTIAGGAVGKRR